MSEQAPNPLYAFIAALVAEAAPAIADAVMVKVGDRLRAADNPFFTVSQAAEYSGLSRQTIRNLVTSGALARARGLKDIRIRKSVLDAYGTAPTPARQKGGGR